jgi:hypothetical protein
MLICYLCELAGRPAGKRFKVAATDAGRVLMEEHVTEPHLAERALGVSFADELVDVALPGGDR